MKPLEVTPASAPTIPQLREFVKRAWANRPKTVDMSVVLLCMTPDKVRVSCRGVSRPEGTEEEYVLITWDMQQGYHAAALEMFRPDLDATVYALLPPYDGRSYGLISFLKHLHGMANGGDYTLHDS